MFNLVLVGLNHRTAELDFRQLASFNATELPEGLKRLSACPSILESMIISTCNRVEIISNVDQHPEGIQSIESFLSEFRQIALPSLQQKLYRYIDKQAIRHVFRVASSLDSMILGEPQILGQLKSCYYAAVNANTVGTCLNSLLQAAFRTAKRVRTETSIGEFSVSASSAAVELAHKIFDDLHKKSILIVGAGKMGEDAVRRLASSGVKAVFVTNRSPDSARELALCFHGTAVPFTELPDWIARVDIVITSTGASEILIDRSMVQRIMHGRKNAPMVFIDISVPRNVAPDVGAVEDVFCYDIDDLATVVDANLHERVKAADAAEKIVEQEVQAFCSKLTSLKVGPVVTQVQDRIEEICQSELQRCLKRLGPQESKQVQELESMISRIAAKIAHPLVIQLRNSQDSANHSVYVDLIKRIFKMNDTDS
jgi:glutamyl-tRNA reductase